MPFITLPQCLIITETRMEDGQLWPLKDETPRGSLKEGEPPDTLIHTDEARLVYGQWEKPS